MKKKIIAFGIVSMFLLMGVTTVSSTNTESNRNVNVAANGTADLTVTIGLGFFADAKTRNEFDDTCKVELYNKETNELVEEEMNIKYEYYYMRLDAGEYRAEATAKGFVKKEISVTIEENIDEKIDIIFERADMPKVKSRTLFDLPMLQRILIKLLNLQ